TTQFILFNGHVGQHSSYGSVEFLSQSGKALTLTGTNRQLPRVHPGDVLQIDHNDGDPNFDPSAVTKVVFSDGSGYQVSAVPVSIDQWSIRVLVPPYLSREELTFSSGYVSVSIIQSTTAGQPATTKT